MSTRLPSRFLLRFQRLRFQWLSWRFLQMALQRLLHLRSLGLRVERGELSWELRLQFRVQGREVPDNKSHDSEASTSIGYGKTFIFGCRSRFPEFDAERRAIEISCHYKAVWNATEQPLVEMGGWLRNYAEDHKRGIELAKTLGVQFVE